MLYLLGMFYGLALLLTIRQRAFYLFGLYLMAELVKLLLYEPGLSWYVYLETPVLVLRCAAVMEAWYLLTWGMQAGERYWLGAAGLAFGLLSVAITLQSWPLDTFISGFNQARLVLHLITGCLLLSGCLWLTAHPVRCWPGVKSHCRLLTVFVWSFVAVSVAASQIDLTLEGWNNLRLISQLSRLVCLVAWCWYQSFQAFHSRLQFTNL